jgi:hypothetical protein
LNRNKRIALSPDQQIIVWRAACSLSTGRFMSVRIRGSAAF